MNRNASKVPEEHKDNLELQDDLVVRLERQMTQVDAGERGEAFEDVVSRLDLN